MPIRGATVADADPVAKLLLEAAASVLCATFDTQRNQLLAFFQRSLQQADGQYGYGNHQLITIDNKVIGLGCRWHNHMGAGFSKASILALHSFWGLEKSLQIVANNAQLASYLQAPDQQSWCLGHIAIAKQYRQRGYAHQLLEHFRQQAIAAGKRRLILDVQQDNQGAIACYQAFGFTLSKQSPALVVNQQTLAPFWHMEKAL